MAPHAVTRSVMIGAATRGLTTGVGPIHQRRFVVRRRQARGHRRLDVVTVVVAPVIEARVERDGELVDRRDHVLHERTLALLRTA